MRTCICLFISLLSSSWAYPAEDAAKDVRPVIVKQGTIDVDLVEATPIVFKDTLYRFEYVREGYPGNALGMRYFRFVNMKTGETTAPFAQGFALGCAYTEEDVMYVFGVPIWGADSIEMFSSTDLITWEQKTALNLPGWGIFNTSVCKSPAGYVMAFEAGEPAEIVGQRFTMFFAHSDNLRDWSPGPLEEVFTKDKYSACPALRFYGEWYYMVYLESVPQGHYAPYVVRSRDLVTWEESPRNPLFAADDEDKQIANPALTEAQCQHIAAATNINNSDVDFCTYQGVTTISYSWGNQQGIEFLAQATFAGTEQELLEAMFAGE
jgi:alpha-L-fucosidase